MEWERGVGEWGGDSRTQWMPAEASRTLNTCIIERFRNLLAAHAMHAQPHVPFTSASSNTFELYFDGMVKKLHEETGEREGRDRVVAGRGSPLLRNLAIHLQQKSCHAIDP